MTYEDIYKEFKEKFLTGVEIEDYRPASPLFVEELTHDIPCAIVVWMKDKSKVIYKSKSEDKK